MVLSLLLSHINSIIVIFFICIGIGLGSVFVLLAGNHSQSTQMLAKPAFSHIIIKLVPSVLVQIDWATNKQTI